MCGSVALGVYYRYNQEYIIERDIYSDTTVHNAITLTCFFYYITYMLRFPCWLTMITHVILAGCHVVAPSDMMDNRVAAIKRRLADAGLAGKVSTCSAVMQ